MVTPISIGAPGHEQHSAGTHIAGLAFGVILGWAGNNLQRQPQIETLVLSLFHNGDTECIGRKEPRSTPCSPKTESIVMVLLKLWTTLFPLLRSLLYAWLEPTRGFPVRRVYCVGRNYLAHVRELGHDEETPPFFFAKANSMIVEDGATIPYPPLTNNYHHEVELVVAIGEGGANISAEAALDHIYGYAVGFDMTRRDLQQTAAKKGHPWEIGKSFDQFRAVRTDTSCCSSRAHSAKERLQITVNGQVRQRSNLNLMIWDVPHIITHLSQQVTLQPGDLIYTGTPEGVSAVVSGDTMVGRIAKLGELTIKVA